MKSSVCLGERERERERETETDRDRETGARYVITSEIDLEEVKTQTMENFVHESKKIVQLIF